MTRTLRANPEYDSLYYCIDMHPEGFVPEPKWRNSISNLTCPGCKKIDRRHFPSPIDAYTLSAPREIMGGHVSMIGLGVRHSSIIEQLNDAANRLALGRLFDRHGEQLEEYVTCYSNESISLHGNGGCPDNNDLCKGTKYFICRFCESVYADLGQIQPYLLRSELEVHDVYFGRTGSLFVTPAKKESIDWSRWPTVHFTRIEIHDELLPDDPWPLYEKAHRELKASFDGDYHAAIDAILSYLSRMSLPNRIQYVPMTLRGVKLQVEVGTYRGSVQLQTLRMDSE